MTPHGLRYTFCSVLVAQGVDIAMAAAQMRHKDKSTTVRIYTHVQEHMRDGVAEQLDRAIWGENRSQAGRNGEADRRIPLERA